MRHCMKRSIFVATAERICWRCVFSQANRTRPAQASVPSRVREGSCNPCPSMIHILTLLRQVDAHEPLGRVHDALPGTVASCFVPSDVASVHVSRRGHAWQICLGKRIWTIDSPFASWFRYHALLCCPCGQITRCWCQSMWKCSRIQCARSASLPTGIDMDRPQHINPMGFSTVQAPLGTDRASIDELLGWKKLFGCYIRLDRNKGMMILFNRWGRFDVCDEMGTIIVAVFS